MLSLAHIHPHRVDGSFSPSILVGGSFSSASSSCARMIDTKSKSNRIIKHRGSARNELFHSHECESHSNDMNGQNDVDATKVHTLNRRWVLKSAACLSLSSPLTHSSGANANEQPPIHRGTVFEIVDPDTYSAVVCVPPAKKSEILARPIESYPLLVVLHGAGNNQHSALYEFTHVPGDHSNLPPYLLSTYRAPPSLSDNFIVVAPYAGKGTRSLYSESRGKILSFVKWFNAWVGTQTFDDGTSVIVDRQRISLFGFSEGSTLAVELATTRQFNGVVIASYGFTGILPPMARERLQDVPIWVFHSEGDAVYDIRFSNQLIDGLLAYGRGNDVFDARNTVKYTKLIPAQNTRDDGGKEHIRTALVASASNEVYAWLLSL